MADATVTTSVVVRQSSARQAPSERPAGRDWDRFDAYHTASRHATGHGGWREGPAGHPAPRAGPPKKKPWWFFRIVIARSLVLLLRRRGLACPLSIRVWWSRQLSATFMPSRRTRCWKEAAQRRLSCLATQQERLP